MLLWLSIAQANDQCYSAKDVWDARCDVGCKREGYHGGVLAGKFCRCYDDYEIEAVTKKKMILPRRNPGRRIGIYEGELTPFTPPQE